MVAAFGSISSNAPGSAATSVAVTCPSGTSAGDLLLYYAANDIPGSFSTPTTGAGNAWALIDAPSTSTDLGTGCWYKFATAADVAGTTSYTAASSGTAEGIMGVIVRYTGVDSSKFPLGATKHAIAHGTSASTTSGAPSNPSSIGATDLVVRVYMAGEDTAATGMTMSGAPAGWTSRLNLTGNTASNFNVGMVVCDLLAGSDSTTITSNKSSMWDIYEIALPALISQGSQSTQQHPGKGTGLSRFRQTPRSTFVGITEDASTPPVATGTGTGTITSASFNPPAGSLLVATYAGEKGTLSASAISDTGPNSWTYPTFANGAGTNGGQVVIAIQYLATAPGPITVTATVTGASGRYLAVRVLNGASPIQTGAAGALATSTAVAGQGGVLFTPTDVNSVFYGISDDPDTAATFTAWPGTTLISPQTDATDATATTAWRTGPTGGSAGGQLTIGPIASGAAANTTVAIVEILPANTYTTAGLTNGGVTTHFNWSYDVNLANAGIEPARTNAAIAQCETDYAQMVAWFGSSLATNISIQVANGGNGATWSGNGTASTMTMYSNNGSVYQSSGDYLRFLLMHEVSEIFADVQNIGWFNTSVGNEGDIGEGLARFLSTLYVLNKGLTVGGNQAAMLSDFGTSNLWLNSSRTDYVTAAINSDNSPDANIGCCTLFLYYLYSQLGYTIPGIIAAGGATLSAVYQNLTGTTRNPFPGFAAMLKQAYPNLTGNTIAGSNPDNPYSLPDVIFQNGTPGFASKTAGTATVGAGANTAPITTVAVGDLVVVDWNVIPTSLTGFSITGGNCGSWVVLGTHVDTHSTPTLHVYAMGIVTAVGTATATLHFTGTATDTGLRYLEFGYTAVYGVNWSVDGSFAFKDNTSSTACTGPTLTPSGSGELYAGFCFSANANTGVGTGTGFTFPLDSNNDAWLINTNLSAAATPTATQSSSGVSTITAALFKVTPVNAVDWPGTAVMQAVMRSATF